MAWQNRGSGTNQLPIAYANGPYTVPEGGSIQLSRSGSNDPDGLIVAYQWDLNYTGSFGANTGAPNPTFSAANIDGDSVRTVALRVRDNHGAWSPIDFATVNVINVAPTINSVGNSGPVDEGSPATVSVSATDPIDTLSYEFDFDNDGTYEVGPQASNSANYTFDDEGSYVVAVRVSDGDGGVTTGSTTVNVTNVVPEDLSLAVDSSTIAEGSSPLVLGSFVDPGLQDTHTLVFDWDDPNDSSTSVFSLPATQALSVGDVFSDGDVDLTITSVALPVGSVAYSLTGRTYKDDGLAAGNPSGGNNTPADASTITVSIVDGDQSNQSGGNVSPLGSEFRVNTFTTNDQSQWPHFGAKTVASDASGNTVAVWASFGQDGSGWGIYGQRYNSTGTAVGAEFRVNTTTSSTQFLPSVAMDADGDFVVTWSSFDQDGSRGGIYGQRYSGGFAQNISPATASTTVAVTNVDPSLVFDPVVAIDENGVATLSGTITDPGKLDTFTLDVNWGDPLSPNNVESYSFAASSSGSQPFTLTHQYLDDNPTDTPLDSYTISATVTDDDQSLGATVLFEYDEANPGASGTALGSIPTNEIVLASAGTLDSITMALSDNTTGDVTLTAFVYAADGNPNTSPGTLLGSSSVVTDLANTQTDVQFDFSSLAVPQHVAIGFTSSDGLVVHHGFPASGDTASTGTWVKTWNGSNGGWPSDSPKIFDMTLNSGSGDSPNGDSTTVEVRNVEPVIEVLSVTSTDENGTVTLSGAYSDVGSLDTHEVTIDWKDGTVETLAVVGGSFSFTHQYLDDNPSGTPSDDYSIDVILTDDDTGSTSDSVVTTIANVAPETTTLTSGAEDCGNAHEDAPITLDLAFADPGTLDEHTVEIDWGDGSSQTLVLPVGDRTLSIDHDYATGGIFDILVTVTDDDTGETTSSVLAVVSGVGLQDGVLQIIGTAGDDEVHVNQTGNGILKVRADFIPEHAIDETREFVLTDVERILMTLCDGDDHATVSSRVELDTMIDGGAGNDHLNGGGGSNLIRGGAGDDRILGGSGRDLLLGGFGSDRLVGNGDNDFLSGGTLRRSDNSLANTIGEETDLLALQSTLKSATQTEVESWRENVDDLFSDLALVAGDDDGESDRLTGSSGEDIFAVFDGAEISGGKGRGN